MTCRECQAVLEEYLDGELGPTQAKAVNEHLTTCNGCARGFNQLQAELKFYQGNGPDIEVTESLWAGVRARLDVKKPSFSRPRHIGSNGWLFQVFSARHVSVPVTVALVLAAVIVTILVMTHAPRSEKPTSLVQNLKNMEKPDVGKAPDLNASPTEAKESGIEIARSEASRPRKSSRNSRLTNVLDSPESKNPEQLVREAENKYLAAIGMLSRDIERRHSQLDRETRMTFEQALASIDRTISATRKAVRQHPADPVAVQYMLSAYARKVDVLREMASSGGF